MTTEVEHGSKVWRVRTWIRVTAGLGWLGLLGQQLSTIHFVRLRQVPPPEVPQGWVVLACLAGAIGLLAFRPFIAVSGETVTLQGPIRRFSFVRADVVDLVFTPWGLGFVLRDGSTRSNMVCQATSSWGEPRWFDVAEAVTGVRPVLDDDGDED